MQRGPRERPTKGRSKPIPPPSRIIMEIHTGLRDVRTSLKKLLESDKTARQSQLLSERRTWIGVLSTFFAMLAIYFFTAYDMLNFIANNSEKNIQILKGFYLSAGILELSAVGICASGLATITRDIEQKGITWGSISFYISIVLGVAVVIGYGAVIAFSHMGT